MLEFSSFQVHNNFLLRRISYGHILETFSSSSIPNIEVIEKCFGPQCKSHVVGFGGGITTKEFKSCNSSKAALLDMLNASEKENELLKKRMDMLENKCQHMDELESKYEQLASVVFGQPSSPPSFTYQ